MNYSDFVLVYSAFVVGSAVLVGYVLGLAVERAKWQER